MHVRTPCVGMCSTTFGDFVCRGCKRWLHEVIDWNAYDDANKHVVVERLRLQRDACVAGFVTIENEATLRCAAADAGLTAGNSASELLLALLRRNFSVAEIGCSVPAGALLDGRAHPDGRALYLAIDAELLVRAQAGYEHGYRVLVR